MEIVQTILLVFVLIYLDKIIVHLSGVPARMAEKPSGLAAKIKEEIKTGILPTVSQGSIPWQPIVSIRRMTHSEIARELEKKALERDREGSQRYAG